MKKLNLLFTALMLVCCLTATAHDFEVNGIYYNITDATNKTVAVTYKGSYLSDYWDEYTGSVVIPESVTYNGTTYSVTSIGYSAFHSCTGLTSIEIPNSVTNIGRDAFSGCKGLTSITIPNSVTSIGNYAFFGCSRLTSVEIPNSVTSIGEWAFRNCTGLTNVVIGNGVTFIGEGAFYSCAGLTSVVIPNSVTSIKYRAFKNCTGLTSITIPNSVTFIGEYAFEGCTGLTSVEIPNSITSIGASAFEGCNNIEKLYIGSSVESIGDKAFAGCEKITGIKVALEKPIRGSADIFTNAVYDNATLYIPNGTEQLYQKCEPWNLFLYIAEMDFTGIEDVEAEGEKVKDVYYDISGRVVENPTNGVYIIDGKKVLIK